MKISTTQKKTMNEVALKIMNEVANEYGITIQDIRSKARVNRLATARAVTCFLLNRYLGMSTTEVGKMVLRTHACVMHSCRQVEGFYLWPKMYATDINIVERVKQKFFRTEGEENGES